MTDRKRALQEAWRALAGPHVGMVVWSTVYHGADQAESWTRQVVEVDQVAPMTGQGWWLPDLGAHANHGVWEAYVREHSDGHVLIRHMPSWTRVGVGGRECKSTCYATALLGAYVRWAGLSDLPPEVLAWWKLEHAEVSDG